MKHLQTEARIITCILPKGKGMPLLLELKDKKNVIRADMSFARGSDLLDPTDKKGLLQIQEEKEIITVVAKNKEDGESLFDFIYQVANINQKGGGLIYMAKLTTASAYILPDVDSAAAKAPEATA